MNKLRLWLKIAVLVCMASSQASAYPETSVTVLPPETSPTKKEYVLSWSTDMVGEQSKDSLSNVKNQVELGLTLRFDMNISTWLSMNLTPKIIAQNGYIQAPDAIDPEGSRIEIRNVSLDIKPANFFNASVGSLDQRIYHSEIFMSNRSFPAARAVSLLGAKNASHVYAFVESDIPTGNSVSNNNQDLGSTPSLNSEGLGFRLGSERSIVQVTGFINAYQFSGLSQDLSTSSVLLGNTGLGTSGANYLFKYGYSGYEAKLAGTFQLFRPLSLETVGLAVQNTQAPTGQNLGWDAGLGVKYDLSRNLQIEPKFDYYRIESDATVAVYNDLAMNTNREGYRSELRFFYNQKIQFFVQYGQRVPIVTNPSQPSETWYLIGLETENAKF